MIELCGITKAFSGKTVLDSFSLTVNDGDRLCITGPSGCGKTTLLRLILGLEKADSGKITVSDETIFSVAFQENRLLPWQTAKGNLLAVGISESDARRMLGLMELGADADKYPAQLSGGMQRRLSLARALAYGGNVCVFDEPMQGLDEALQSRVLDIIDRKTRGKTLIVVTHNRMVREALHAQNISLDNSEAV